MRTKVRKWGNSLALRIPSALAADAKAFRLLSTVRSGGFPTATIWKRVVPARGPTARHATGERRG